MGKKFRAGFGVTDREILDVYEEMKNWNQPQTHKEERELQEKIKKSTAEDVRALARKIINNN